MIARILLLSSIDPSAVAELSRRHDVIDGSNRLLAQLAGPIAGADCVVVRSGTAVDAALLGRATRLRLVIRAGSGTDNLDLAIMRRRHIRVETIPGPGAAAVAEMTIALMLALLRNVVAADRSLRAGEWRKPDLTGAALDGKTLGIVGAGNIGTRVGRLASALGMRPIACVERPSPRAHRRLAAAGIRLTDCEEVISASEVVSLHVPLTARTRSMIDADALATMRRGTYLINLARGGVLDEHALRAALDSGHLAGAALDVHEVEGPGFRSPLADAPNVVLTPHIGAGTHEAQREIGRRVVTLVDELDGTLRPLPARVAAVGAS